MRQLFNVLIAMVFATATGVVVAAGSSGEQGQQMPEDLPPFAKADKNGDKNLSWKEAKTLGIPKQAFNEQDYDGDGKISKTLYDYAIRDKAF